MEVADQAGHLRGWAIAVRGIVDREKGIVTNEIVPDSIRASGDLTMANVPNVVHVQRAKAQVDSSLVSSGHLPERKDNEAKVPAAHVAGQAVSVVPADRVMAERNRAFSETRFFKSPGTRP